MSIVGKVWWYMRIDFIPATNTALLYSELALDGWELVPHAPIQNYVAGAAGSPATTAWWMMWRKRSPGNVTPTDPTTGSLGGTVYAGE